MKIVLIAAMSQGRVIGNSATNSIPWTLPEDMAHFKATTMSRYVVMGRKTWESIPPKFRPLSGRINIIVTSQRDYEPDNGAILADSVEDCLRDLDRAVGADVPVYIIGGRSIYEAAMPFATDMVLTQIHQKFAGDLIFPHWSLDEWHESDRQSLVAKAPNDFWFDISKWKRTVPAKSLHQIVDDES